MRSFYFKIAFPLLLAVLIIACDKVKNPSPDLNGSPVVLGSAVSNETITSGSGTGVTFITRDNFAISGYKKVLLEDYTGQKCGNCPPAAQATETLSAKYGDSLIAIAVHAGGFAVPGIAPYTSDYRTPAGDTWDGTTGFNISLNGNPNGMINRVGYPTGHRRAWTSWDNTINGVSTCIRDTQDIRLNVTTYYDATVKVLNVKSVLRYKRTFPANEVKLSLVLSEDSIAGTQKNYLTTPNDQNFMFMHMMRGAINGDWGNIANSADVAVNDSTTKLFQGFTVSSAFNDKHLSVVVFAYRASNYEILQVEKIKIR